MWIKNFFNELNAWRIVRREYRNNRLLFESIGLKKDWGGRLYKVINRDPEIVLGSDEDEVYLRKELSEVSSVLIKCNIYDILAYELKPLEEVTKIDDTHEEYEHGYLITLTPAWNLDRQYVTFRSVIFVILFFTALIGGLIYSVGSILYAVGSKKKYMHSVFHFFCIAASICHYFAIYLYVL